MQPAHHTGLIPEITIGFSPREGCKLQHSEIYTSNSKTCVSVPVRGVSCNVPLLYNNTSATKCQVFCAKNIKTDLSAIAVQVCSDLFRSLFHLILPSFFLCSQFILYCKDHNVLIPAFRSPPVFFIVYQYTTIPSKRPPLSGRTMLVFIFISPPFSDFSYAYQLMLTSIVGIFLHLL